MRMSRSFLAEVHVLHLEAIDFIEADIVVVESTFAIAVPGGVERTQGTDL